MTPLWLSVAVVLVVVAYEVVRGLLTARRAVKRETGVGLMEGFVVARRHGEEWWKRQG